MLSPRRRPSLWAAALMLVSMFQSHSAFAGYVSILDNTGGFSIVDTDTGIADTKAFGLAGYSNLAFNSTENLYYTTDSQNHLRTITPGGTVSGQLGLLPQLKGLAFDDTGSLFGYDFSSDELLSIDPMTGLYASQGSTGFVLDGPGSQMFYTGTDLVVLMDQLGVGTYGTLDRVSGSGTMLLTDGAYLGKQILGFASPTSPLPGLPSLFLSDSISLYSMDLVTGEVTQGPNIQYSSCDCVPEPTSLATFGLLSVLPFMRKKRRQLLARWKAWSPFGRLRASSLQRYERMFVSQRSKKIQMRRAILESLEPRMLMTVGPFQCDPGDCPCSCADGSTSTSPATGFGTTFGQSMGNFSVAPSAVQEANYSANTTIPVNGMYGNGRLSETTPSLVFVGTSESGSQHIQLPWSGTQIRNFRQTGPGSNVFQSDVGGTDQITREGNVLVYRNPSGETIQFRDFSGTNTLLKGQFISRTDVHGNRLQVTSNQPNGAIASLAGYQKNSDSPAELWQYAYIPNGSPNAGKLQSVQLRRNDSTLLRSTLYTYYNKNDPNGSLGDLKLISVRDGSSSVIDSQYFRYYKSAQPDFQHGFNSALKYSFDFDSFRQLAANIPNIDSAIDAQIAPYAKEYFRYDSSRRIVRHDIQGEGCTICTGGIGTTTFSYETRPAVAGDYNRWAFKVTQTLPDGNQKIIYENYRRQVMLEVDHVLIDSNNPSNVGKLWGNYTRYDATTGKPIWRATPSALELPSNLQSIEQYPDLMRNVGGNLQYVSDDSGVIHVTSYFTETTATQTTAGGIRHYASQQLIRRGEFGSDVLQSSTQYYSIKAAGTTQVLVAAATQYPNEDQSNPLTTSHQYTFYAGSVAIQSKTTFLPLIVTAQNGPNTTASTISIYDRAGREISTKDADGFLTHREYDAVSGAKRLEIVDVNTMAPGGSTYFPGDWTTPAGGGRHLISQYDVDQFGRTIRFSERNGTPTFTFYDDAQHSQRSYLGWDYLTHRPLNGTRVVREDILGSYSESLTMSATPNVESRMPTGTEPISNLESLSRTFRNAAGQVIRRDDYFNLDGLTYSTNPDLGTEGVHFYRTRYQYNNQGLLEREQSPSGTTTWSLYDGQRRLDSTWIGTDDTTANGQKWAPTNNTGTSNMTQVSEYIYDENQVGNGNITRVIAMPGVGADRVTEMAYDWRDRRITTKKGAQAYESDSVNRPLTIMELDNMGRVLSQSQYDGDGVDIHQDSDDNGVPDLPDVERRKRHEVRSYDNWSRVFRTESYLVDQNTGATSSTRLTSNLWYDKRSNVIQQQDPNGPAMQFQYDGAGWQIASFVLGNTPDGSWSAASDVNQSVVLESTETRYDPAGNPTQSTRKQRFHDADPTAIGPIGSPTSGIPARVSYQANYYDIANRVIASADFGTNDGLELILYTAIPAPSDTVLVSTATYDPVGNLQDSTDPRGIVHRILYDAMGRKVTEIQNYTGSLPGSDSDVTSHFTYSSPSQLHTISAVQAGGGMQTTEYVYQARTATGSRINSNDFLTETRYPDPATGLPSMNESTLITINALGGSFTFKDQNGTLHHYAHDVVGRLTEDYVDVLGNGVDNAVQRIVTDYGSAGMQFRTTSYHAPIGAASNEVYRIYNGFGQLIEEYQDHFDKVNPATTPKITYSYSEASGGNHSRLTAMTYPDGRTVHYEYDAGIDAAISRLSSQTGDATGGGFTDYEEYEYLGASTIIQRARPESGITLTMVSQTGSAGDAADQYTGLDRFGRVVDQRWIEGSGGSATDVDRYTYQFDRNNNRTARINQLDAAFSETYAFDGVDRLVDYARGGGGSGPQSQQWNLDALGNWTTITSDGTPESRTHNAQNELTGVGTTPLAYDANGNMTQDEAGRTLRYNAWNRLVRVSVSGVQVAEYQYNGHQHRIVTIVGNGPSAIARDLFYSANWQLLEQRIRTGSSLGNVAEEQFVWSAAYIDGLILRDRDADLNAATGTSGLEERVYALQDALWNTTALVYVNGNVLNRFAYTPYGVAETLNANWNPIASPSIPWTILFRGYFADEGTSLLHARNRQYSPTLGRFAGRDPLGYVDGYSQYRGYFAPNGLDPSGMCDEGTCDKCKEKKKEDKPDDEPPPPDSSPSSPLPEIPKWVLRLGIGYGIGELGGGLGLDPLSGSQLGEAVNDSFFGNDSDFPIPGLDINLPGTWNWGAGPTTNQNGDFNGGFVWVNVSF